LVCHSEGKLRLRVFETRMMREVFGVGRKEGREGGRKERRDGKEGR
jgi:hypothetical protein